MKSSLTFLFIFFSTFAFAQNDDCAHKNKILQFKVDSLERVVDVLKKANSYYRNPNDTSNTLRRQWMQKAQDRVNEDLKKFPADSVKKIEELYQQGTKNFGSDESRKIYEQVVNEFPNYNRAGCACLYVAQMSKGKEKEKWLNEAIERFSDCMYGDGVIVGAYARFYLEQYYSSNGQTAKADKLISEIKEKYPDAVDHNGKKIFTE